MARIQEEVIVITVSKLHRNSTVNDMVTDSDIVSEDTMAALASVAEELLGNGVVVEVSKA
jgi:hypothetical protein